MLTNPYSYYNSNYDYCLIYKEWLQNNMLTDHAHKTFEVYYLTSGKRNFFIKNQLYVADAGTIIFIAPDVLHKTTNYSDDPYSSLIINFRTNIFPEYFLEDKDFKNLIECDFFMAEPDEEIKTLLNTFIKTCSEILKAKPCAYEIKLHSLLTNILFILTDLYKSNENLIRPNGISNSQNTVNEIKKYIAEHFDEDLALEKISTKFFISTFHLCRIFKQIQGVSLHDYITTVRINEAKNYIDNYDIKISALYRKLGFKSEITFIRAFKSRMGITPLQYRKKRNIVQDNDDSRV